MYSEVFQRPHSSVDVHVASKSDVAPVEAFFKSLPAHTHVPGVTVSVSGGVGRPPMEADERTLKLWHLFETAATEMGLKIDYIATADARTAISLPPWASPLSMAWGWWAAMPTARMSMWNWRASCLRFTDRLGVQDAMYQCLRKRSARWFG